MQISFSFKEIFLTFVRRCLHAREKCCCSEFSLSTVFSMIENVHKIFFMQWRHTQVFFSDLLFKKRPLKVTFTDFLNNQIICFLWLNITNQGTHFKLNHSYKKENSIIFGGWSLGKVHMVHNAVFLFFPSKFNVHSCPLLHLLLNVNEILQSDGRFVSHQNKPTSHHKISRSWHWGWNSNS